MHHKYIYCKEKLTSTSYLTSKSSGTNVNFYYISSIGAKLYLRCCIRCDTKVSGKGDMYFILLFVNYCYLNKNRKVIFKR